MRATSVFASSMLVLGSLVQLAGAQSGTPVTVAPPFVPATDAPSTTLSQPSVINLGAGEGLQPFHFTGELGMGLYSIHGAGPSNALLGTSGSVNVLGDHIGAGIGWFDASQSFTKPGAWSISHRP